MNLAFLVTRLEKPSARYRVLQYLPYLRERNWNTEVFIIPGDRKKRRDLFRKLKGFDVVFLQKKLLSYRDLYLLRRNARKLVYDFDDAVMFRDTWRGNHYSFKRRWAFARTARNTDRVIAGNSYLMSWARRYTERVGLLPTPIPMERYPLKDTNPEDECVTLGWLGSSSTIRYLELIRGALESLSGMFPGIRLKIVSDSFLSFNNIPVENKMWNSEDEISDLHSFDVGLMPLTDDVWTRGKCGFKLLQYMAAGVPVVCSPVGMNREIVQDGVQGYWAETQDEWIEKLSLLIRDPLLRKRMADEGRKQVEANYSLSANSVKLMDMIKFL
jgi:glycosyltransferase involved in cell wall biosynthesis